MNKRDRNYLERVKAVNEVYLQHKKEGVITAWIYRTHIQKQFYISEDTFFRYLAVPYKKKLAELDKENILIQNKN